MRQDREHARMMQEYMEQRHGVIFEARRSPFKAVAPWIRTLLAAFVLAFFISQFVVVNAAVVSGSMENTIMTDDRVICNRLAYLFSDPQRFDVIAFERYSSHEGWVIYVKRIIGMPGERVEIINGMVYIDDASSPLPDNFVNGIPTGDYGPFYVPPGHYFVLGDNRDRSSDSKNWDDPFLPREQILGRALFVYYPRLSRIEGVAYS